MILIAQIITAAQMVYEEKYIVTNDIPPLQAVGWEGIKMQYLSFKIMLVDFVSCLIMCNIKNTVNNL